MVLILHFLSPPICFSPPSVFLLLLIEHFFCVFVVVEWIFCLCFCCCWMNIVLCFCCCWMNILLCFGYCWMNILLRIIERLRLSIDVSTFDDGNSKSDQSNHFTTKTGSWDNNALKTSENSKSSLTKNKLKEYNNHWYQMKSSKNNKSLISNLICHIMFHQDTACFLA